MIETTAVTISPELSAVKDGAIVVRVLKMIVWPQVTRNYSKLQVGPTLEPAGTLNVAIPVSGVKAGDTISVEQLARVLQTSLEALLPICAVFTEAVATDFGYKEPEIEEGGNDDF